MPSITRALLLLPLSAALLLATRPADACTPPLPPCGGAPMSGATIPANAPALAVWTNESMETLTLTDLGTGTPVPFDLEGEERTHSQVPSFLVIPSEPLTAGARYEWNFRSLCYHGRDEPLPATFTVTEPAPWPTTLGEVTVEEGAGARALWRWSNDGSCGDSETVSAAFARIHIRPSAELLPFLPVAHWTITVDDAGQQRTLYGAGVRENGELPIVDDGHVFRRPFGDLVAQCSGNGPYPLGEHDVTVSVHIAGSDADPPPVTVRVKLDCDGVSGPTNGRVVEPGGCDCGSSGSAGVLGLALLALWRRRTGRLSRP